MITSGDRASILIRFSPSVDSHSRLPTRWKGPPSSTQLKVTLVQYCQNLSQLLSYQNIITKMFRCKYGNELVNHSVQWQMIIHARLHTNPFEALPCWALNQEISSIHLDLQMRQTLSARPFYFKNYIYISLWKLECTIYWMIF